MRVLLDTNVLLWWILGGPRLSQAASDLLSTDDTIIVVSAVSGHEIATKYRLGKLSVPTRLADNLDQIIIDRGWQALPLSVIAAQLAGRLTGTHRDPFDRMLAAQAIVEDVPIVTNDPEFIGFGARVFW